MNIRTPVKNHFVTLSAIFEVSSLPSKLHLEGTMNGVVLSAVLATVFVATKAQVSPVSTMSPVASAGAASTKNTQPSATVIGQSNVPQRRYQPAMHYSLLNRLMTYPQTRRNINTGYGFPMLPFLFAGGDFSRKMAAMSMMMQPGQQNSALPYFIMSGSDMWPLMAMMGNNGNNRQGADPLLFMALGHDLI